MKARAVFKNPDAQLVAGEFAKIKIIGVVSNNIIIAGFISIKSLPVQPYPSVVPAQINVQATSLV